ncbi:MAG TPA: hypothetical protein DDW98_09380 [Gammaproteobacteria bacterium]|nr:hypothetical protein [Gammaproteobacteria bacterium]
MAIALAIFSVALVVISMYGVLLPKKLLGLIRDSTSGKLGLWSAVNVRLLLVALLWFTAHLSRTPALFRILAAILFLSAIAHVIVGRARLRRFLASLDTWPPWAIRVPCLFGVAMGGFMLWAVFPPLGAA